MVGGERNRFRVSSGRKSKPKPKRRGKRELMCFFESGQEELESRPSHRPFLDPPPPLFCGQAHFSSGVLGAAGRDVSQKIPRMEKGKGGGEFCFEGSGEEGKRRVMVGFEM